MIFLLVLLSNTTIFFAESFFVGQGISNIKVEQYNENNIDVFYQKDNGIYFYSSGEQKNLYQTKNNIVSYKLYNNGSVFVFIVSEKTKKNSYYDSILIYDEHKNKNNAFVYNESKDALNSVVLSWNDEGFDVFGLKNLELFRIRFLFGTNDFQYEKIEDNVIDFKCKEWSSQGYFVKDEKMYLMCNIDVFFTWYEALSNLNKFLNVIENSKNDIYLIEQEDAINLYKFDSNDKLIKSEIYSDTDINEINSMDLFINPMFKNSYLFTYKKTGKQYISLVKDEKNSCSMCLENILNMSVLPVSFGKMLISCITNNSNVQFYFCDFENNSIREVYADNDHKINSYAGLYLDKSHINYVFINNQGFVFYVPSNENQLHSEEKILDNKEFIEGIIKGIDFIVNKKLLKTTNKEFYQYDFNDGELQSFDFECNA
ncbi:MAG: hypothetical protein IIT58_04770 [Treponema sp.]|nr:hypothetical protein [Treponema sp.]